MCFKCDNETDFFVEEREIEQEYHNTVLKVITPLTICNQCGWECMTDGQADELCKRTKLRMESVIENAIDYNIGY